MSTGAIVATGAPDELGERRAGMTTIRFRVDPARAADLGVVPEGDGRVAIETKEPVSVVNRLTTEALRLGIEMANLEITRMTLEEAYLRLVSPHE
jgi:hypothetical protein